MFNWSFFSYAPDFHCEHIYEHIHLSVIIEINMHVDGWAHLNSIVRLIEIESATQPNFINIIQTSATSKTKPTWTKNRVKTKEVAIVLNALINN